MQLVEEATIDIRASNVEIHPCCLEDLLSIPASRRALKCIHGARLDRMCELNVARQVINVANTTVVQEAWRREQPLSIHGWIYSIANGKLSDLDLGVNNNPELRTPVFVVPGLLGVILTTTMILMTALSLVRERERGTFEFLIGTPVQRGELMVGKLLPYVVIGLIQIVLVLLAGLLLFRVPVEGSLFHLALASLLFIAANLTLGLVISSLVTNQLQATQAAFFFFLPSVLLSGFMFPFESMPEPAQWLGELLPLTHFNRLTRSILLRGTPVWDLAWEMGVLALMFLVGLVAATRLFRKTLA